MCDDVNMETQHSWDMMCFSKQSNLALFTSSFKRLISFLIRYYKLLSQTLNMYMSKKYLVKINNLRQ